MICPVCREEILDVDKRKFLPIDSPVRLNLTVHDRCYRLKYSDIIEKLAKNKDLWYNNK